MNTPSSHKGHRRTRTSRPPPSNSPGMSISSHFRASEGIRLPQTRALGGTRRAGDETATVPRWSSNFTLASSSRAIREYSGTTMPGDRFPNTSWTLVARAGELTPDGRAALATLFKAYWFPVYAFIRRRGGSPDDAYDRTQAFFVGSWRRCASERAAGPRRNRPPAGNLLRPRLQDIMTPRGWASRGRATGGWTGLVRLVQAAVDLRRTT